QQEINDLEQQCSPTYTRTSTPCVLSQKLHLLSTVGAAIDVITRNTLSLYANMKYISSLSSTLTTLMSSLRVPVGTSHLLVDLSIR
ncbi:unnamed protein product, partial [Rotaria magnacalcarata]